ncbi:hypothetical protein GCM10025794_29810 [Massilia kyonggiensis]
MDPRKDLHPTVQHPKKPQDEPELGDSVNPTRLQEVTPAQGLTPTGPQLPQKLSVPHSMVPKEAGTKGTSTPQVFA